MKQKRVMIVGASAWQVPMLKKAKDLGYLVGVVDYNPNAVGIPYADQYFNASTNDAEGVCEATRVFGADGITTVATDMPMRAIAHTCKTLGLIGIDPETAIRATDKAEMIRAFAAHGVPHPWFRVVKKGEWDGLRAQLSFPCICKPIDNSASRGVVIVRTPDALDAALRYSSESGRSGDVILEELLEGEEISVEAFAVRGEVHVLAVTDKLTTGSPYFVEMGHDQPSHFCGETLAQIRQAAAQAMLAVGIENGPAHVEMMVTARGPVLIELGARLGGDFITTDLVPLSTGIDILGNTIHLACGEPVDLTPKLQKCSAVRYMKTPTGVMTAVDGLDAANAIPGVHRVEMLKPVGSAAVEIRNSLDRLGYAIAQADTRAEADRLCGLANQTVRITIE